MKKLTVATILALSTFAVVGNVNAQGGFQDPQHIEQQEHKAHKHKKHHNGGFVNSTQAVSKIADAVKWKDDQFILLEGNIVQQVGKEDYLFKDDSGEITVEIDRKAFAGQTVTPNDKVRIYAEVDKSWDKTEVEAQRLELVK